jgi:hypothetical protein
MLFSKKPIGDIPENFILHDQLMENVKSYNHIGIERKPCSQDVVETRIKTAIRTSYALMGAGMHGYNGIKPRNNYESLEYIYPSTLGIWPR